MPRSRTLLVDGTVRLGELLLEREGTEGLLVLGEIAAEDVPESFGLLGAEVDALEVLDGELVGVLLRHGAEDQEEVPDAHANLNAVGVAVAVVLGVAEFEGGLVCWRVLLAHRRITFRCSYREDIGAKGGRDFKALSFDHTSADRPDC
jgi:hypothetical protein